MSTIEKRLELNYLRYDFKKPDIIKIPLNELNYHAHRHGE